MDIPWRRPRACAVPSALAVTTVLPSGLNVANWTSPAWDKTPLSRGSSRLHAARPARARRVQSGSPALLASAKHRSIHRTPTHVAPVTRRPGQAKVNGGEISV